MADEKKLTISVDLNEKAQEILQRATEHSPEHAYLFLTTFARYQEHLKHLAELKKALDKDGPTVTKEYVKGRANIYVNPAMNAYNTTAKAADATAQLLLKYIVQPLAGGGETGDEFDSF